MDDDLLFVAIESAATELGDDTDVWVVVVGHLVDVPLDNEPEDGAIADALRRAIEEGDFPQGPLAYVVGEPTAEVLPDYRIASFTTTRNGRPYVAAKVALGIAGFVALGGTRRGLIDEGPARPGHVLLADVEGFLADTMAWVRARAQQLDYDGEATIGVALVNKHPADPVVLRALDEKTGALAVEDGVRRTFSTVTARYRPSAPTAEQDDVAYDIARRIAEQFGAVRPQLLQPSEG